MKSRKPKKIICLIIGCVSSFLSTSLIAQSKYINVEIPIQTFNYPYSGCEPSIAINPKNKKHISAGSILDLYHFSKDGGKSWKTKKIHSKYGVFGDPVVMYNTIGDLFYFHLSDYEKSSHLDRIVCQKSTCLEGNFNNGSFTTPNGSKVQDKHWVVLNPMNNEMYMTWTQFDAYDSDNKLDSSFIMFAKSIDKGNSWSDPVRISKFGGDCLDSDNTVEGAVPAIGRDGAIVVVWTGPNGLMMQRSLDKGNTWLMEEKKIMDHPGGWDINIPGFFRANGLPFLVSDMSGKNHSGTLYLNWADQRNGLENTDIWLMKSEDNGETWSTPIRVNQDSTSTHQFLTNICIDQKNGDLHFVFYDRSRFAINSLETEVTWVKSIDGGLTFKSEIISSHSFKPIKNMFFGDYIDIDANEGMVRPIWPTIEDGRIKLWTALIDN